MQGGFAVTGTQIEAQAGMIWIPGGTFSMGSENFYVEEMPVRRVSIDGFWIDATPVIHRQYAQFVATTGC